MANTPPATPVVPVRARITYTANGQGVPLRVAQKIYGDVRPDPEPAWFWIFRTPRAVAAMRFHGHRAVGSLTTTQVPFEPGAELPQGEASCERYNQGEPHRPHLMDPPGTAVLCQGFNAQSLVTTVTSFTEFCHCKDSLLDDNDRCLICGTSWVSETE